MTDMDRIEAKLNVLAKAMGGPALKEAWSRIEVDLPKSRQTFRKASCGCWKGSPHVHGCRMYKPDGRRVA